MTATPLPYESDTVFRTLVDEWTTAFRCPVPLVDRCLELDLYGAAVVARWASDPVRCPDRPWWETNVFRSWRGAYPAKGRNWWFWVTLNDVSYGPFDRGCYYVPKHLVTRRIDCSTDEFPDPTAAILCLLAHGNPDHDYEDPCSQ